MKKTFKVGEKTKDIWSGDIVSECEFLANIEQGRMLFYDITFKCFRLVFPELYEYEGQSKIILNGWKCSNIPSELL